MPDDISNITNAKQINNFENLQKISSGRVENKNVNSIENDDVTLSQARQPSSLAKLLKGLNEIASSSSLTLEALDNARTDVSADPNVGKLVPTLSDNISRLHTQIEEGLKSFHAQIEQLEIINENYAAADVRAVDTTREIAKGGDKAVDAHAALSGAHVSKVLSE